MKYYKVRVVDESKPIGQQYQNTLIVCEDCLETGPQYPLIVEEAIEIAEEKEGDTNCEICECL